MMDAMTDGLGLRIRRARERRRMSQVQVAEAIRVSVRSIGSWERGEAVPRSSIGALEEVLGTDLSEDAPPVDPREEDLRRIFPPEEAEALIQALRGRRRGEGSQQAATG